MGWPRSPRWYRRVQAIIPIIAHFGAAFVRRHIACVPTSIALFGYFASLFLTIFFKFFGNSLPHHVWCLFDTRAQVFLVNDELTVDWLDVAASEHGVDLLLVGQVLVLKPQVVPDVVGWHHSRALHVLDPRVILKCVL